MDSVHLSLLSYRSATTSHVCSEVRASTLSWRACLQHDFSEALLYLVTSRSGSAMVVEGPEVLWPGDQLLMYRRSFFQLEDGTLMEPTVPCWYMTPVATPTSHGCRTRSAGLWISYESPTGSCQNCCSVSEGKSNHFCNPRLRNRHCCFAYFRPSHSRNVSSRTLHKFKSLSRPSESAISIEWSFVTSPDYILYFIDWTVAPHWLE